MLIDRCSNGELHPAENRMMHDCELSRRAYWKGVAWLVKAGLLHRYQDAIADHHPRAKSDWRRNSYELNWPLFNEHYAARQARRRKFRHADMTRTAQKNACTSVHVTPDNTCTSVHVTACTSVHANRERGTLKESMNHESAFGAAAHGLDNATMQPSELTQWLTGGLPPSPRPSKVHQNTLRHRPVGKHCA
jgi:hypothetical protein